MDLSSLVGVLNPVNRERAYGRERETSAYTDMSDKHPMQVRA